MLPDYISEHQIFLGDMPQTPLVDLCLCATECALHTAMLSMHINNDVLCDWPNKFQPFVLPYCWFISLGAIFLNGQSLASRNFPDLEIHNPDNRKLMWVRFHTKFTHVDEHLDAGNRWKKCLSVNWHNIHDPFAVAVHIESSVVWANLLSRRAFIAYSISAITQPLELLLLQL